MPETFQAHGLLENEVGVLRRLNELQEDIIARLDTLTGDEVSKIAVKLSVLLGNISEILASKEQAYYIKWLAVRGEMVAANPTEKVTDGRTEKRAKATVEYYERKKWEGMMKSVDELIKSLKKRREQIAIEHGQIRNI